MTYDEIVETLRDYDAEFANASDISLSRLNERLDQALADLATDDPERTWKFGRDDSAESTLDDLEQTICDHFWSA